MALVTGTCSTGCPAREAADRSPPTGCEETVGLVKRYARSAAGYRMDAAEVRPLSVLLDCTSRLLVHIRGCPQPRDACAAFVSDRLRAIRQDAIVQQAASPALFVALIHMLRFHEAAAFLLTSVQGGCWDVVQNDQRIAEVVDLAHEVWDRLFVQSRGEASAEMAPLRSLHAELLSAQLLLAWPDAAETKTLLRAMLREGATADPVTARTVTATRLWAACRWEGLLRELDAWSDEEPGLVDASPPACNLGRTFLRCLAQRYVPLVRAALLRTLNVAMLDRQPMPVAAAASLMHFRTQPSSPTWFQCARFLTQWQLRVVDGGAGSAVLSAEDLRALLIDGPSRRGDGGGERSETSTSPAASDLAVCWNKAVPVDPCSVELRARVAVAGFAEPAAVPGLAPEGVWATSLASDIERWRAVSI